MRVLAWQRIKDREVNGMKRRILTVCLLLALLLTPAAGRTGAGESAGCEAVGTGEEAAEPPDETPEPEPAKPEKKSR